MSMLSRFAATGGSGDPYWDNVSYLLVGNGANGTTTNIVDSSKNNIATTPTGVVISTTQNKYGSGSLYFNGSSQYIRTAANSGFTFGTGDFTVELWFYSSATGAYLTLFSTTWAYQTVNQLRVSTGNNNNTLLLATYPGDLISAGTYSNNSWNYLTVTRSGTTLRLFLNGVITGTVTNSQSFVSDTFGLGGLSEGYYFNGYMYDVRVTKGIARYTANFTPPTAPLPIG